MADWQARLCSEVTPTTLEWLWPGYLAHRKLAVLDGDPGMGKSLLTLDLIARLTRGGPLPDGTPLPRAYTCALLSAEDDPADTIRPRAEAAGADLSRLVLPDVTEVPALFPRDCKDLSDLVVERGIEFLVIDRSRPSWSRARRPAWTSACGGCSTRWRTWRPTPGARSCSSAT
jgi:hypothetical protein